MSTTHQIPRVHHLLLLHLSLIEEDIAVDPHWLRQAMSSSPWAVVRRSRSPEGKLAIGVRGKQRNERWGGFVPVTSVQRSYPPYELCSETASSDRRVLPAIQSLQIVENRLWNTPLRWGPGGSVGYELASGDHAVSRDSDLDLVIEAPEPLDKGYGMTLWKAFSELPTGVDVKIETPYGGFSLEEYLYRDSARFLLHTFEGPVLTTNPWAGSN